VSSPPRPISEASGESDPASGKVRSILFGLYALIGAVYLTWRLTVFNPDELLVSAVFYVVELGGYFGSLLLFFVTLHRRHRVPPRAPSGLAVDVFITTVNEDIEVVRRSLVAAKRIRYPHETWLLDDGNRPSFRAMAAELRCRYLARADNAGAKAGNLNNALRHAHGKFVALLDADHCAAPEFLDRLLGYFDDPDVAFVQTPQDYYNLNSFQHGRGRRERLIWHDQSGFHHVEQPGRDHLGATTLCGCSCIMRRAHLDRIGGFPDETVTEDMHAAVKLQKLGLRTIYHDEPLAFGVAPPDLMGFVRQRLRWGEGNMQVCRIEGVPLAPKLTWRQNISYLLLGFTYADAWRKLILYIAPIVTLITDVPPIYGYPVTFLYFFVPFVFIGVLTYQELYSGYGRIFTTEAYTMARLTAGLGATWGLVRRKIPFRVSSKQLIGNINLLLVVPYAAILIGGLYAIYDRVTIHMEFMAGLRPPGGLPPAVALILAILVAYNCYLAFIVLYEAFRSSRTNEPNYQFDLTLPLRLSNQHVSLWGWTELVTIGGVEMRVAGSCALSAGDEVAVELFLPGQSVRTPARIIACDTSDHLRLQFLWPTLSIRDELDQALHAGRWHRVVTGRYEGTMSPCERFGLLTPSPDRRPEARGDWNPVLVRHSNSPNELQLAYLRGGEWKRSEIILFESAGGFVEVAAAPAEALIGQCFEVGGPATTPLLDETALEGRGGARYCLREVEYPARSVVFEPLSAAE
jgi:cellulose synthase (UDP-forming)